MNEIVRRTTPTIQIRFTRVRTTDIQEAFLTIKCFDKALIEKGLDTANVNKDGINWRLSQEDTEVLPKGRRVEICCDWKTYDGTRGRSEVAEFRVANPGKDEVI